MSKDPKSEYYDAGGIETLEIIKAKLTEEQYDGYCLGNAIKYLCRCNWKAADYHRDIEKASNYLSWIPDGEKPAPPITPRLPRGFDKLNK